MSKWLVAVLAGTGGIFVGLAIAKAYAQNKVGDNIHDALGAVGLAGGPFEEIAKGLIIPQVG